MITYNDFINSLDIPSKENFDNGLKLCPYELNTVDFGDYDTDWQEIDDFLVYTSIAQNSSYKVDDIDIEDKTISLYWDEDSNEETVEGYNKICKDLEAKGWTITDKEEYLSDLSTNEENLRDDIITKINNMSITELKDLQNKLK